MKKLLAILLLIGRAGIALGHEGSTSYLALDTEAGTDALTGRFEVALIDLAWSLPLDGNADGRLSWNEIVAERGAIAALLDGGLQFARGGDRCETRTGEPWLMERLGLPYLSVDVRASCSKGGPVGIASTLFFDGDAYHRVLVSLHTSAATQTATLAPASRAWREPATASGWRTGLDFLRQGMWHVWIGYDHLLFLLLLLLPAVTRRRGITAGWGRAVTLDLARTVTAFTVAHSITLALAASAVLRLPQRPIEVAIAVSIVAAAGLNLAPRLLRFRLPLAFAFGLVHGFGFANALAGLGIGGAGKLPVLAGFNVGVELANLAVIAVALPLLLRVSRYRWYEPQAMRALSLAAAAVGATWVVQRL